MHASSRFDHPQRLHGPRRRRAGLRLLAVLMIPLLLVLHAPVLAALVPGALLTIASLESATSEQRALPPLAEPVLEADLLDIRRVEAASPVVGQSRRVG